MLSIRWLQEQVNRIPGPKKWRQKWVDVVCPFHDDTDPSLGIRIADPSGYRKLGDISCWSCGTKGAWNKLAEKLGLALADSAEQEDYPVMPSEINLLDSLSKEELWKQQYLKMPLPWDSTQKWRKMSGQFLSKCGAYSCLKKGRQALWMPVYVQQDLVGSWTGQSQTDKKIPTYLNSNGQWVLSHGLWPYDRIAKYRTPIICVEGPRDAYRLIKLGYSGIQCFGTQTMTREKAMLLLALERPIYIMGDGDSAGHVFNQKTKKIFASLGEKTTVLKLPDNVDPFSMPASLVTNLQKVCKT